LIATIFVSSNKHMHAHMIYHRSCKTSFLVIASWSQLVIHNCRTSVFIVLSENDYASFTS